MENHLLSIVTFLPVFGAVIIALIPKEKLDFIRWGSAAITGLQLILAIWILYIFDFLKF